MNEFDPPSINNNLGDSANSFAVLSRKYENNALELFLAWPHFE